jgi:hypothetical protein
MKAASLWMTCLVLVLSAALTALAQETPPAGGGPGGRSGGRSDWRQRIEQHLKDALGTTEEEWKAIQPKLEKVAQAQRELRSSSMRSMFGRSRRGGDTGGQGEAASAAQPSSPLAQASKDLQATLDNKAAKPEEIKAKLEALRAARAKAREELKAAQKDLTDVLTQRQEAVLVGMGLLE